MGRLGPRTPQQPPSATSRLHCTASQVCQVLTHANMEQGGSLSDNVDKAQLLAVTALPSGDWLHALPLSNCGLRLDDSAVQIVVGLRLGANICEPHQCPGRCQRSTVHGLSCKGRTDRSARRHELNNLIWRTLFVANISAANKPPGLLRSDGKRSDEMTLIPWQNDRGVKSFGTSTSQTQWRSRIGLQRALTSVSSGGSAKTAAERKTAQPTQTYTFNTGTLWPVNSSLVT